MLEEWKDIEGYEDVYQISNKGRVMSFKRNKGKLLKQTQSSNGYLSVKLYKNLKGTTFNIHILVATSFLGHIPSGFNKVVDHIDGNKLNNDINNLRIVTNRENSSTQRGSSKYTGVSWNKKLSKWVGMIWIKGNHAYLGGFEKEEDAHKAYINKLKTIG